jgi:hypothetical protein
MRPFYSRVLVLAVVGGAACGDNNDSQPFPIDAPPDTSILASKCDDGIDNDGDGRIDYPADPGCLAPNAGDETDDCPDGPYCPQCANGRDDDGNGTTDYPDDPGCMSASDNTEIADNPVACGTTLMIRNLPATGMDVGMLDGTSTSQITSPCGGGGGAPAIAYRIGVAVPTILVADTSGSMLDTVLDLRSADCDDAASEIACHDDVSTSDRTSKLTRSLQVGTYFLIVSGVDTASSGEYAINVQRFTAEGGACTANAQCGPDLVCRVPGGQTAMVCTLPQCADTFDDDADGKNGFPDDPGCASAADNDETDDCPSGPNCPACSNGTDDDGDNAIDYPADTSCASAGGGSESCNGEQDPVVAIVGGLTQSTLVGAHDDHDPSCGGDGGGDVLFTLKVPDMRTITIDTENSQSIDTVLSLLSNTCSEPSIECDDDDGATPSASSLITRTNLAAGTYIVAVDNYNNIKAPGPINVNVEGVIAPGGQCGAAYTLGGALACPASNPCVDINGVMKCQPSACGDGMDNDADGLTDFPADPGCTSLDDTDESDTCASGPGPGCPECADGIDNDGDGNTDAADSNCTTPSTSSEGCVATEAVTELVLPLTGGTTVGATNDLSPACTSTTNTAPDRTYNLQLPDMQTVTITSEPNSFDAVVSLLGSTCTGAPLACTDSPEYITKTNLPGGQYFFVVDGYGSASGTYSIGVSGTIRNGASCESPLAQSGAISCATGFACKGAVGSRTCLRAACNDGLDNDGDGIADFPNDPGCSSVTDDDEADGCPGGANCPVCSNGLDDDNDGYVDYPDDTECASASGDSESCAASEGSTPLVLAVTPGTTAGATNDSAPACGSSTNEAPDRMYALTVPALTSLSVTSTSSFDHVLALYDNACGLPALGCSDPGTVTTGPLAAGTYRVLMDGYSSASGTYTIMVSGKIAAGESCDGPLALSGALVCSDGYACSGAMGSRTCQPSLCNNGIDDDADGHVDYPNDPGCESMSDNDETDPAIAPVCANGMDDDADGLTDYPDDFGCSSASGTSEVFCTTETNPIEKITMNPMTGTTTGLTNDFTSTTCISSSGEDKVLALILPVPVASLTLDLSGSPFDTVMQLRGGSGACGAEIACADGGGSGDASKFTVTNLAAGTYAVVIDGWSGQDGAYTLTTKGTVAAGTSCSSPLFAAGVLACPTGTTCMGVTPTCQ